MVAMELAEVVNPPFIFPVVGVVLCAVLVYAFGFKSPVQPPSFAFEDEGKKSNKKQKKAKVSRLATRQAYSGLKYPELHILSFSIAKPFIELFFFTKNAGKIVSEWTDFLALNIKKSKLNADLSLGV